MMTRRPRRVALSFVGDASVSKVQQSFAADADINVLMGRYKRPDILAAAMSAVGTPRVPRFGDFSSLPDYPTMCGQMRLADSAFASLPAVVRDRFNNSVEQCLDFIADPANVQECVALGFLPESALPVKEVKEVKEVKDTSVSDGAPAVKLEPTPPAAVSKS